MLGALAARITLPPVRQQVLPLPLIVWQMKATRGLMVVLLLFAQREHSRLGQASLRAHGARPTLPLVVQLVLLLPLLVWQMKDIRGLTAAPPLHA